MKVFIIGRSLPEKHNGMIGVFEKQQALAISKYYPTTHYVYFDDRSIKVNHRITDINFKEKNLIINGKMIPIRGLPNPVYKKLKSILYIKFLNELFLKYGVPDVIHIHFPLLTMTEQVWDFLISKEVKIIVTEHWSKIQTGEINNSQKDFLKKIYSDSDAFICVSEDLKKGVQSICDSKKNIYVIPNMVSDLFKYKEKNKKAGTFNFIAVGRLTTNKRFDLLIDAFNMAFKDDDKVFLTILGDGKLKKILNKKIERYNLQNQIFLEGFKEPNEVAKYFQDADCYVSASNLETFGVPTIEAWMSGIPVIIADNSPLLNYINQYNGVIFEVDNPSSLCDKLEYIYKSTEIFNKNKICEYANRIFSEEAITLRLIEIYLS